MIHIIVETKKNPGESIPRFEVKDPEKVRMQILEAVSANRQFTIDFQDCNYVHIKDILPDYMFLGNEHGRIYNLTVEDAPEKSIHKPYLITQPRFCKNIKKLRSLIHIKCIPAEKMSEELFFYTGKSITELVEDFLENTEAWIQHVQEETEKYKTREKEFVGLFKGGRDHSQTVARILYASLKNFEATRAIKHIKKGLGIPRKKTSAKNPTKKSIRTKQTQ